MTRARPMSKSERAALADALRHMKGSGVRHGDLARLAGSKVWLISPTAKGGIPLARGQS
jgi:hypothetical protein